MRSSAAGGGGIDGAWPPWTSGSDAAFGTASGIIGGTSLCPRAGGYAALLPLRLGGI